MKTKDLLIVVCMTGAIMSINEAVAQGRGNAKGHDKQEWRKDDHNFPTNDHRGDNRHDSRDNWNDRDNRWDDRYNRNHYDHERYSRRYDYHRPPHWAPAHGYHKKPRYVYYRDYNVYYDCYRGEYITFSGRNYIYSYTMPPHLCRANFDRIMYVDLDFYDDDLPRYLERRRGNVSVSVQGRF
jgi:hypothetical protein